MKIQFIVTGWHMNQSSLIDGLHDLEDETIVFFLHDDIIIKDWIFIHECIERLHKGFKVIGNCRDYTAEFDPFKTYDIGISEEFDGKAFVDYVKPENKHLFDTEII